jgi:2-polyprenyl-3-methyl-5-hydroxy-6-metoxy-1,4-benzoquinol methylase
LTNSATHSAPPETQVQLHRCWVCGSPRTMPWKPRTLVRELTPDDFRITDSNYGITLALRHCRDCDFIFAEDEEARSLTRLYEQLTDPEYEKSQDTRALQMRWLISAALDLRPEARSLLDIGAGSGLLVAEARRQGLDAIGVEPCRAFVEMARSRNAVEVLPGIFPHPQLAKRHFDLIFLVDVIEHVSNPLQLLRHCAQALNAWGVAVVVTPDIGSITARVVGKRWWHFRLAHVGYFSRRSLAAVTGAAGLIVLKRFRGLWFFRVYYLAERLAQYLPLSGLNRLAPRFRPLAWLYQRVLPVNLHDSTVLILGKDELLAQ